MEKTPRAGGDVPPEGHPCLLYTSLRQGLARCREMGLARVLVTCNRENRASARTILACGGVLEDEREREDGGVTQRYWIAQPPA